MMDHKTQNFNTNREAAVKTIRATNVSTYCLGIAMHGSCRNITTCHTTCKKILMPNPLPSSTSRFELPVVVGDGRTVLFVHSNIRPVTDFPPRLPATHSTLLASPLTPDNLWTHSSLLTCLNGVLLVTRHPGLATLPANQQHLAILHAAPSLSFLKIRPRMHLRHISFDGVCSDLNLTVFGTCRQLRQPHPATTVCGVGLAKQPDIHSTPLSRGTRVYSVPFQRN